MILVYCTNYEIDEVESWAKSQAQRISFRNPRFFDTPENVDEVWLYGRHQNVDKAYRDKGVKVVFIDYKFDLVESEPDKEPCMNWTVSELRAYAKLKGIPLSATKKEEILDAILNHSTTIH